MRTQKIKASIWKASTFPINAPKMISIVIAALYAAIIWSSVIVKPSDHPPLNHLYQNPPKSMYICNDIEITNNVRPSDIHLWNLR